MRSVLVAAAGIAMAAGLVACGGADGDPRTAPVRERIPTTATTHPDDGATLCALLPEGDVAAAFGEPVVAGTQSSDECWWSTPNDLKTVNLIRRTEPVETWRSGYDNPFWEPNDLGDEGYTGTVLTSIVWRIDGTEYEVNVVYSTTGEPAAVVEQLAAGVVARL